MHVYLDNGSATKTAPEVVHAMQPYWEEQYGNPQSLHQWGRAAQEAVEHARKTIAAKLGVQPPELIFTSSGTESNNTAIFGTAHALKQKGNHIITSQIEHVSVLEACKQLQKQGFTVTYLPVSKDGLVNIASLQKAITDKTILVSIMHANNEIGTIQPIKEIYTICQEKKIVFHTDAIQSFCKTAVPHADLISVNAHKLHGPKGVGALVVKEGTPFIPLLVGGPHEFSKRASTHNVPGIVGFGKAVTLITEEDIARMQSLRDKFIDALQDVAVLNGSREQRLCNNVHMGFKGTEAESLMLKLDEKGIASSMGSACHAHILEPSYVLKALRLPPAVMLGSLRFVLSKYTTQDEIDYTVETTKSLL